MSRPLLLDLFCGQGGCAMGYHRAGFDVIGVDKDPQPRYPFEFCRDDAMDVMRQLLAGWSAGPFTPSGKRFTLGDFAVIHASPPCQRFSTLAAMHKEKNYPDLIAPTRNLLIRSGKHWIIENVVLAKLDTPTILCGSMFGLGATCADGKFHQLRRHRAFECSFFVMIPPCCHRGRPVGVYGNGGGNADRGYRTGVKGFTGNASERRQAMGIDWMTRDGLSQAIPPAYTEFVGKQLMAMCGVGVVEL